MSYYCDAELKEIGFKNIGCNVLISKKCSIYGAERIMIGNNVRIDDFCVISAGNDGIEIGNNVHIAVFCLLIGNGLIKLFDYCGLSSRVSVYSSTDDYSGNFLTNPTLPSQFTNVKSGEVILEKHVIVGSGSIILPNVTLQEGVAIGALSLVNKNCETFWTYLGVPAKKVIKRKQHLLELENDLLNLKKK
ncbi:hexapeptide repeat-containing transferase [Buttiauxella gaviniae ATCC 51604]|uniref:Hexapeptide repeat-containing transferase n=1 Tax=Buttiauxella gaviniae ATCC 51604 TaxID=1354253 RepID=A0A1B7I4X1_9ENTR|nr:acyltransferase [Buttiauxella gaviniae]OAT23450.1 hexapeptide repeat-containing transferase [Buttiauxella gaviniae ATCC 51604]